ncbi:MAG: translation initiation factor Sui1 [Pseudomonadota bacterium]
MKTKTTATVYSTEHGRICPDCDKPVFSCICRQKKAANPAKGGVRVGRETKGRKGKGVTTISGLPLDSSGLEALAKDLKKRCGSGGTVKDGVIEIQGDHRDVLLEEMAKRGWPAKRSGG